MTRRNDRQRRQWRKRSTRGCWIYRDEYRHLVLKDPCVFCGGAGGTVDHIQPLGRGGADLWDNFAGACLKCNNAKGDMTLLAYLMTVEAQP